MNPAQQVLSALHDDLAAVSEDSVSPEFPETPLGDSLGHRLVIEPMLPLSQPQLFSNTLRRTLSFAYSLRLFKTGRV